MTKMLIILLSAFLFHVLSAIENDVEELTNNLFENLRADPILLDDAEFSEESKAFIDKQVKNYLDLMLKTEEEEYSRSKRSLSPDFENLSENYLLDIKPFRHIPATSPRDIVLFQQNATWYAAILETEPREEYSHVLKIKKLQDNSFEDIVETSITKGVRIATFPLKASTLIIVAENDTARPNFENKTNIFMFTSNENIEVIQKINTSYASYVAIWEEEQNIYMAVAQFMKEGPQGNSFEVDIPIYKWYGKHFDIIQSIGTSGGLKISPFSIEGVHFLGVVNSKSHDGKTKSYSEILKYNIDKEKYEPFQRIQTYGCNDMKYFKTHLNEEDEHFVIVVNTNPTGVYGKNNTLSIIYKYVDDYFIPFQSIKLKGVVEWQAVMAENGEVLLLAATTFDGIKSFQYDGWHFVESKIQEPNNEITSASIKAMHFYKFQNKTIVVIANENDNGNMTNIFEIQFSSNNKLKMQYKEMLEWCSKYEKEFQTTEYNIEILSQPLRGDISEEMDNQSQEEDSDAQKISNSIKTYSIILDDIEGKMQNSLQTENVHVIDHDLRANEIVVQANSLLNSPQIENINNVSVDDLFENVLNIHDGFDIDSSLEFSALTVDGYIFPEHVNSLPASSILHKNSNFSIENLLINGVVNFLDDLMVERTVNDKIIDKRNVLLKEGEQDLEEFIVDDITVNNFESKTINELEINATRDLPEETKKIKHINELSAERIIVGGYINNIDVPTLNNYALRYFANKPITGSYHFDSIDATNLETNMVNTNNVLSDFVQTSKGRHVISKDVKFTKDLIVNNLTAINYLDSISVRGGKLDILQRNSSERQYISGIKSFENLELLNPIKLQGKIRSKDLDTMNPVVTIDSNLDLNGDIRITGDVIVDEIIKSKDIVTSDGVNSLLRVQQQALKLTDPEIPIHLTFLQHINVQEVFVDRINNIDPGSWIVNGAKHTQVIQGWKEFQGDLEITGDTSVSKINDIDIADLPTNVLRQNGDQVITGKHSVKAIVAEKSVNSKLTEFGSHSWHNVIRKNDSQIIGGNTIFNNNLLSDNIATNSVTISGLINHQNFSEIVSDAATTDTTFKIFSNKILKNITINNLKIKNSQLTLFQQNQQNGINLHGATDFPNETTINNIYFTGSCNGVDKSNFENINSDEDDTKVVDGDQAFDEIKVFGTVYISSNFLNNINFTEFVNTNVRIDEPFHLESATFSDIIVNDTIELDGHVEHFDLDTFFQNGQSEKQTIIGSTHFYENITVDGNVRFDDTLNGYNISDICALSSTEKNMKSLIVEGNAYFAKGPHVFQFNGLDVQNLQDTVWFEDEEAQLLGNINFENNVTFKDNVTVMGLVNDIHLQHLSADYLSKSKNQTIAADMTFLEGVLFHDDISTPQIKLGGEVNGIKIEEFVKTVMLNHNQLFEEALYLENCFAEKVDGYYKVNGLNLENEVMRYDKTNMVTGYKIFKNLDIGNLNTDKNITVQNVDIRNWMRNSALIDGDSRISGKKHFKHIILEKGLSLKGLLNGQSFSEKNIMLKNVPQVVTGRKRFIRDTSEEITFEALKVKGLINNVDITELAHNGALKHGESIFKSEIHYHNNISTKNIVIDKLYQGVNASQLLKNISTLGVLNNFQKKYSDLLDMSNDIEDSITGQAYFLHSYKPLTCVPEARKIFGLRGDGDDESKIMTINFQNGSNIVNFFQWNDTLNVFVDTTGYSISFGSYPTYINQVILRNTDYIYIENEVDPSSLQGHTHLGTLIHFNTESNTSRYFQHIPIYTRGTIFLISFQLEILDQQCLLFIDWHYDMLIICEESEGDFNLFQTMSEKAHMASAMNINGWPYLITIKKGSEQEEPHTSVWKFNNETLQFEVHQTIYEGEPISLTTVSYNSGYYLAVAYGHLQNTMHLGRVAITRFDEQSQEFKQWQYINMKSPTYIEFTILPSGELVLYMLTHNPTEPFNVYVYEGISGFSKKITGSAIPDVINMNQFSINNKHFVVAEHYNQLSIIQAIFKGEKFH